MASLIFLKPFDVGPFKGVLVSGSLDYHIAMSHIHTIMMKPRLRNNKLQGDFTRERAKNVSGCIIL
ncbi:MAG: hypothetical protein ACRD6B_03465 [Bryobacteraceae bacterium]